MTVQLQGVLSKMAAQLGEPVEYALRLGEAVLPLNEHLGKTIRLRFTGKIQCTHCGRATKKSYSQGYCYPCSQKLAACDLCIVKPELCHYDKGTCREPEWGEAHCMQSHIVYLANASGVKVGITRHTQIPTRWIDQGAMQAIPVFQVKSRFQSGLLEIGLKKHVSDRTDWRRMLKGPAEALDLLQYKVQLKEAESHLLDDLRARFGEQAVIECDDQPPVDIIYPVLSYPEKVKSLGFDKLPDISGLLEGIKGQYLLLSTGVLNIRKHTGYVVEVELP